MPDNKGPWGNNGGKKGNNPWGSGGKPDRSRPKPGDSSPDLENVIQGFKTRVRKTGGGGRGPRGAVMVCRAHSQNLDLLVLF